MMAIFPGQQFGRWMVLNDNQTTPRGEKKWLCRCECGTERYVLERSLQHGGSQSCGCLRLEALNAKIAYDITGQNFGDLTVLARSDTYHKNGGIWWRCRCSCGNICEAPATVLVKGRKSHCGCKTQKDYYFSNITNQRFGRLIALYRIKSRTEKGGVIWHCRCDCGNEVDIAYNNLMYANQRSCGCLKKEHDRLLSKMQTRVDGTSLDIIKSNKLPSNNSTGYKGVYLIRGKYTAKIVFRKKAYYLGTYDSAEKAHETRLDAEEALYQSTIEYHARWQAKVDTDPEWAAANPMQIFVRQENNRLYAEFAPAL